MLQAIFRIFPLFGSSPSRYNLRRFDEELDGCMMTENIPERCKVYLDARPRISKERTRSEDVGIAVDLTLNRIYQRLKRGLRIIRLIECKEAFNTDRPRCYEQIPRYVFKGIARPYVDDPTANRPARCIDEERIEVFGADRITGTVEDVPDTGNSFYLRFDIG